MGESEEFQDMPKLKVKLDGLKTYPSEFIIAALEVTERALEQIERDAVRRVLNDEEFSHLFEGVADEKAFDRDAEAAWRRMRRRHLQVYHSQDGSLELFGNVGGGALVVAGLLAALPLETLKDAWKSTSTHKALRSALLYDVGEGLKSLRIRAQEQSDYGYGLEHISRAIRMLRLRSRQTSGYTEIRFTANVRKKNIPGLHPEEIAEDGDLRPREI